MVSKIKAILSYINNRRWKYLFSGSNVRSIGNAHVCIDPSASIRSSTIVVTKGSTLKIADGAIINHCNIYVNGYFEVCCNSHIGSTNKTLTLTIDDGKVVINHHSKICCSRVWVRFGGQFSVGRYTNINYLSEIRCDEQVSIGDYGMISYNVKVWDTNTHSIYTPETRRKIAEKYWPYFGKEIERPKTLPVIIGNDVWIGENASILKGTEIGDRAVVGYGTILSNKKIEADSKVVTESNIRYIK